MRFDFARGQQNSIGAKQWVFFFGPESVEHILNVLGTRIPGYENEIVILWQPSTAQTRDQGNCIWRLLNLEIWMRIMLDAEPVEAVALSAKQAHAIALN